MMKVSRKAAALAMAAAFSMAATPALANHDWGWGGYRHRDRGIDAGDVIAGVLIIGGIAAIASAASKSKKDRERRGDYRYPDNARQGDDEYRRDDDRYYRGSGSDDRPDWQESRGINGAIERCASEVERGNRRIESVESVNRDGAGWRVAGRMEGGRDFACTLDGDGRIRNVEINGDAV